MIPLCCTNSVEWFGLDMRTRCTLPAWHKGAHDDGLWAWDEFGVRVDGVAHTYRPGPGPYFYRRVAA